MITQVQIAMWSGLGVACLAASAVISGVETGCYTLNRVRLDVRAARTPPDAAARHLFREINRPQRLLATLLIANTIVHYFSALATTNLFALAGVGESTTAFVGSLVLTPILFVLGEAVPKELFRLEADRLTYVFARPLTWLRVLLSVTGVLPLVRGITALAERAAGLPGEGLSSQRQQIFQLLKEGAGRGVLSESQVTLLDRAMVLREVTVGDEMVPWSAVRAIPADADRARVLRMIGDVPHMRVPAIDRSGRVVGVLRHIDLHLRPEAPVSSLLREPTRLRARTPVREALAAVRQGPARLGVVEDDAGRAIGIVTLKDLVEPLTGELADL